MTVTVTVVAPLIVAALCARQSLGTDVGGNDAVDALINIEPLEVEHARAIGRSDPPAASSSTVSITPTASLPLTSAATIRGATTPTTFD